MYARLFQAGVLLWRQDVLASYAETMSTTAPSAFRKWYPVTYDFGLIEAPVDVVAAAYKTWWVNLDKPVEEARLNGSLDEMFSQLEPLSMAMNRAMFLPTAAGWTAFFRNGILGSDPSSAMPVLAKQLDVRAMRICDSGPRKKYPAVIWEFYDPSETRDQVHVSRRSIAAANDGGRWVFEVSGTAFPFENIARYNARRKRDRFDRDLLLTYLANFGIDSLDDRLLAPALDQGGVLISQPYWDHVKSFSLDQVTAGVPWQR